MLHPQKLSLAMALFISVALSTDVLAAKKIRNFDAYQKVKMEMTEFPPSREEFSGKSKRIAVTPVEVKGQAPEGDDVQIASTLQTKLEALVQSGAELIDRAASKRLLNELRRNELKGKVNGNFNASVANLALMSDINSIGTSFDFNEFRDKDGRLKSRQCTMLLEINATVKIFDVANNKLLGDVITVTGMDSLSQNASSCESVRNSMAGSKSGLAQKALQDVVDEVQAPLLTALVPTGYVTEKRVYKKGVLFKISLGDEHGLGEVKDVAIMTKEVFVNELFPDEKTVEERVLVTGDMTNQMSSKSSWVYVKAGASAEKVRLGDYVQLTYKAGSSGNFFDKLRKAKDRTLGAITR